VRELLPIAHVVQEVLPRNEGLNYCAVCCITNFVCSIRVDYEGLGVSHPKTNTTILGEYLLKILY